MAIPRAPFDRRIRVRDKDSGEIRHAHPVDAREMIASGHYELDNADVPLNQQATDAPAPDSGLVAIDKLSAHLDTITDADQLLALESTDQRPEAKPMYEARFNFLASNPPAARQ